MGCGAARRDPGWLGSGSSLPCKTKCCPVRGTSPETRYIIALGTYQTEGGPASFLSHAVPMSGTRTVARDRSSLCKRDNLSLTGLSAAEPLHNHKGCTWLEAGSGVGGCMHVCGGCPCVSAACFSPLRLPGTREASAFRKGVLGPGSRGGGRRRTAVSGRTDVSGPHPKRRGCMHRPAPLLGFAGAFLPCDQDQSGPSQAADRKHNLCACFITAPGSEARGRRPSCESVWQLKIIGKQLSFRSSKNASDHIMMFH